MVNFMSGRRFLRSRKVLIGLTASYLAIIMISALIGSFGYRNLYVTRREQLLDDYKGRLGQAVYMADEQVYSARQAMLSVVFSARTNSFIYTSSPMNSEDYYNLHLVINDIVSAKNASKLNELFLFVDGIDSVVMEETRFDTKTFYQKFIASAEIPYETFRSMLTKSSYFGVTPAFSLNGGGKKYLMLTVTLPLGGKVKGTVCGCFDTDSLMQGFAAGGLSDNGHITVNSGDTVVCELGKAVPNSIKITADGKYGFDYAYDLDPSLITGALLSTRNFIIRMYLFELLCGVLIAVAFGHANYSPLKRLLRQIGRGSSNDEGSEYERILDAAGELAANNNELSERLTKQLPMIKASVLRLMVSGSADIPDADEYGLQFPYKHNTMLAVTANSERASAAINYSVISLIESMSAKSCVMYPFETDDSRIAVIVNCEDAKAAEHIHALYERIKSALSFEPYFAVSETRVGTGSLNELYKGALDTLAYALAWGKKGITYQSEITGAGSSWVITGESETALAKALTDGRSDLAVRLVGQYLTRSKEAGISGLRIAAYSIMNVILRVRESWHISDDMIPDDFMNTESIPDELCRMAEETADMAARLKTSEADDLGTRVKRIIEQRYSDSMLSLTDIAQELELSVPYISTLFKQQTGMGFTDALGGTRLHHAEQLLQTTDLSVQAIAEKCGYSGAAYFTRVFKNRYGVTPGQFRKDGENR